MSDRIRGIHPRLVPRAPDPRPSLAVLPALRDVGDDFAWAVWYAVWRVRDGEKPAGATTASERLDRFGAALGCVPELDEALETIRGYLQGTGDRIDAADALSRVADWALEHGRGEAAIQCAEAAAALEPVSVRRALAAGRASRFSSEPARAAIHYERAMTLARFARKWRSYVRAHLGLGYAKKALGDPSAARAHFYTAARAARNLSGEKWLAAQTRHDLMGHAAEQGACNEALHHARKALEWYPTHHSSLPALAHDVAFLLVRMNEHARAVPLLEVTVPKLAPREQVIGWSTLARASAWSGDYAGYRDAAEKTLRLVGLFDAHAAAAFANLAHAAHRLELWHEAEQYALRSLEISGKGAQAEAAAVSGRLLAGVRARSSAAADAPGDCCDLSIIPALIAELTVRMAIWRGQTWKRKQQSGRERLERV